MNISSNIGIIFNELTTRYDRISASTIKSVLKGKLKTISKGINFQADSKVSPMLDEAVDAFKKYNCAIFTAFRGGYSLEENLERNAKLKADMDDLGMKFRPVNGCYREADWEYPCVEYCFFVYNSNEGDNQTFFENAFKLSAKYDQDSFLYKRAGINRSAFLVATTEAGRKDLRGDIKFAGQLYLNVPDVEAWTDCSDGRFAFQLKGMVLINTSVTKIKIGEGDIFDIEGYTPDGIVVIRQESQDDYALACKSYNGEIPLVEHVFTKDDYSKQYVHDVIFRCMKKLRDLKCKRIGFHCTVAIDGSTTDGAAFVFDTLMLWAKRYDKKLTQIVIVDSYGDYSKSMKKI